MEKVIASFSTLSIIENGESFELAFIFKPAMPQNPNKITVSDFELERLVGKGGYSMVFSVRNLHNLKVYAMKIIKKIKLFRKIGK